MHSGTDTYGDYICIYSHVIVIIIVVLVVIHISSKYIIIILTRATELLHMQMVQRYVDIFQYTFDHSRMTYTCSIKTDNYHINDPSLI